MDERTIPAEILEDLATAVDFAAACQQAVDILTDKAEATRLEAAEAAEARDLAAEQLGAATRGFDLAAGKYLAKLKAAGLVRTADGYRYGTPNEIAQINPGMVGFCLFEFELDGPAVPAAAEPEIDAGPALELRIGGRDGKPAEPAAFFDALEAGEQLEPENCCCEHVDCGHEYGGVPAGARRAAFVGRICDECADTHMSAYVLAES